MYFGKTVRDPKKYLGSGQYWKKHIKIHGTDIETVWSELFVDKKMLIEFAKNFSETNNIVNAVDSNGNKIWANVVPEDGLQGGQNIGIESPLKGKSTGRSGTWKNKKRPEHSALMKGRSQLPEHSAKISESLKKYKKTKEHCSAISKAKKGISNTKISIALTNNPNHNTNKGKKLKTHSCNRCGFNTTGGNLKRWHNENCKYKKETI